MRQTILFALLALLALLAACTAATPAAEGPAEPTSTPRMGQGMGMMGMGRQSGMMARHRAPIPAAYADLKNPTTADEASLQRGAELFATHCATCHGDGGMGDGPTSAGLDPSPAPIAHTSQMMGDNYLFYRVSEGGALEPFNSAMPAWKGILDEQARWDVLNYVQALGSGAVTPRQASGGAAFDPAAQVTSQADMLAAAVDRGVLTEAEATVFTEVHTAVEALRARGSGGTSGSMADMQAHLLAELVQAGTITQAQADSFSDSHARLLDAGLMQ